MLIENVHYEVNWDAFLPGTSIFIPCLDADEAKKKVKGEMFRLGYDVVIEIRIEEDVQGLRIWRIQLRE